MWGNIILKLYKIIYKNIKNESKFLKRELLRSETGIKEKFILTFSIFEFHTF